MWQSFLSGRSAVVAHLIWDQVVVGSNPAAQTTSVAIADDTFLSYLPFLFP